ncbi:GDP-fucose protein O-fucosyltransferase 1-like isoform X2 [Apostichopus japonicus]|uniref:GDP-fucose protein O-fucosyltransferase 1-like isoform X2 n=1 Tax=Stichopus japonicus TaxID=307972 RepID=UPI003AB6E082
MVMLCSAHAWKNVPFTEWFLVEPFEELHRVITMEEFLENFGVDKWPPGKRVGYCGMEPTSPHECNMKVGTPLKPFWDELNIDFDDHEKYNIGVHADITNEKRTMELTTKWNERYPVSEHPVIVFRFPPAPYPMQPGNRQIQRYLQWNPNIFAYAEHEISRMFNGETFLGIHLRTGPDWVVCCRTTLGSEGVMASTQCLAPGEHVFENMCYPTVEHIVNLTKEAVVKHSLQHLFIATDKLSYSHELNTALKPLGVKVHHLDPLLPQMDLMILGEADFFIGNCASSFTSFVKRQRDANGKPSTFWGFPV